MNNYYTHQNTELISMLCDIHDLKFEYGFRYKLDRKNRIMIDQHDDNREYLIPTYIPVD